MMEQIFLRWNMKTKFILITILLLIFPFVFGQQSQNSIQTLDNIPVESLIGDIFQLGSGTFIDYQGEEVQILHPNTAIRIVREQVGVEGISKVEVIDEQGKIIYKVTGKKKYSIFYILPVTTSIKIFIDAKTGELISIDTPWWKFLAKTTSAESIVSSDKLIAEMNQLISIGEENYEFELDIPSFLDESLRHPSKFFSGRSIRIVKKAGEFLSYPQSVALSNRDTFTKSLLSKKSLDIKKQRNNYFVIDIPIDIQTGYYTIEFEVDNEQFYVPIEYSWIYSC